MEVLSNDFWDTMQYVSSEGPNRLGLRVLESFALVENKIPGCVMLEEARKEYVVTNDIIRIFFSKYKSLPKIPLPIAVYKHDDFTVENYVGKIEPLVSASAFESIEVLAKQGLGVYLYAYPDLPVRVNHLEQSNLSATYIQRRERLNPVVKDYGDVICSWIDLFCSLLFLEYLPGSPESLLKGALCDPNNAGINGGFLDIGSAISISKITSKQWLYDSIHTCVELMVKTICLFLTGDRRAIENNTSPLNDVRLFFFVQMKNMINKKEHQLNMTINENIKKYFHTSEPIGSLEFKLRSYYPSGTDT
jgi:hypothetical protein